MKCFMYHKEIIAGKVFELSDDDGERSKEIKQLEKDGWVDTPAKLSASESTPDSPVKRGPGRPKKAE